MILWSALLKNRRGPAGEPVVELFRHPDRLHMPFSESAPTQGRQQLFQEHVEKTMGDVAYYCTQWKRAFGATRVDQHCSRSAEDDAVSTPVPETVEAAGQGRSSPNRSPLTVPIAKRDHSDFGRNVK
jgi:hypothetical protein